MATAGDQINRALRLLGVLAEGETPSASESNDALVALNQMLDSWSTERLAVYTTQDQEFTWPSGQISRTIGPTGDFAGTRPVLLDDATYFKDPGTGISYGIQIVNQADYNSIALKTATSTYPQALYIEPSNPNATLYVYPVPNRDLDWHFVSVNELSQVDSVSTVLAFPPGYLRAFTYNLAMEIAPEFGVEPSQQVARIAMVSKRNIKRINNPEDHMNMPSAILTGYPRYNIFAGNY